MRKPMMAGNWKMNKTIDEAATLARSIHVAVAQHNTVERVVCPTALAISAVVAELKGSPIQVGAQNMHFADSGAFTGEISAPMLKGVVQYVLIGHSERRQYFAETDETVNKKVVAALKHGLTPILCVGESLEQRQSGVTDAFVGAQVKAALTGIEAAQLPLIVIAYEPIWAIGTGLAATSAQAQETCAAVRTTVAELYGIAAADTVRVLYGGSTNEKNITELMQQPDIDGALIGGAALKVESYGEMVRLTSELYG